VTILSPAIGLQRETTSNESGLFNALSLPVGDYEIRNQAAGFKSFSRNGIRLDGDQVLNLRFQL